MLRRLVKISFKLRRGCYNRHFTKFVQKLNSAQTCYNFKPPPIIIPLRLHVFSRFVFLTDISNPIQDFYYFFVRQTINGKLFILSSPYAVLEHPVKNKMQTIRVPDRFFSFSFSLSSFFFFLVVKFTTGTTIGGSQGQPTHKENREEIHIPRTHNAQRQAWSPLLGKG